MTERYSIIYADCPWQYEQSRLSGAAEHHYPTMKIDDICALPVTEICADDCILFMWATHPMLPEALQVIKSWGFTYKTVAFTWLKTNKKNHSIPKRNDDFDDIRNEYSEMLKSQLAKRQLENDVFSIQNKAQVYSCPIIRLDYQQENGLMSSLPLGLNLIDIHRGLTTSSTAMFIPFITQELFQDGEALYYGLNALSNNMIMVDRKRLKNPNGLILGTPGSGKSFSAKREITNAFLITNDDIIICDPESEYFPLVDKLGGQVIKISPISGDYVNPMDLNLNYSEDDSPLSLKADFILSLCELIIGGKDGLSPVEKTVIDRSIRIVYRTYIADPKPENIPILEDLYNVLLAQHEDEARNIATALIGMYGDVHGRVIGHTRFNVHR